MYNSDLSPDPCESTDRVCVQHAETWTITIIIMHAFFAHLLQHSGTVNNNIMINYMIVTTYLLLFLITN